MEQDSIGIGTVQPNGAGLSGHPSILVAQDDPELRVIVMEWLTSAGYAVIKCTSVERLIDECLPEFRPHTVGENQSIDLIITDLRMPGRDGLEALEESLSRLPLPPMILIASPRDVEARERAERLAVAAVVFEPLSHSDLMSTVEGFIGSARH